MQDEVNEKTIALCIKGAHISADILKAAMRKYLIAQEKVKDARKQQKNQVKTAEKAEHAKQRARRKEENKVKPQGKQTLKKLINHGAQLTNIEITDKNVKSFDRVARKYGIDYSLKKDLSADNPRYMVFFKSKDVDVMTAAFKEYAGIATKLQKKKSLVKKLKVVQQALNKNRERVRVNQKDRGQSL